MDPFTLALATFGIQKLRGKSTRRALRDATIIGGGAYGLGQLGGVQAFQGAPLSSLGIGGQSAAAQQAAGLPQMKAADIAGAQFRTEAAQQAAYNRGLVGAQKITSGLTKEPEGIAKLLDYAKKNKVGTALTAATVLPLLAGEPEPDKPPFTEEDYKREYEEQLAKLEGGFEPAQDVRPSMEDIYRSDMFYANQGGLAEVVKKFNTGGVSYLPSKTSHDENDANNYIRATGYVEDGAGNGDKDEDTMLAQLADGEFVSRADAVLGAGILSGADPKSFKSMRKAGADFFYDQQKKFKRIYDLINASKQN